MVCSCWFCKWLCTIVQMGHLRRGLASFTLFVHAFIRPLSVFILPFYLQLACNGSCTDEISPIPLYLYLNTHCWGGFLSTVWSIYLFISELQLICVWPPRICDCVSWSLWHADDAGILSTEIWSDPLSFGDLFSLSYFIFCNPPHSLICRLQWPKIVMETIAMNFCMIS